MFIMPHKHWLITLFTSELFVSALWEGPENAVNSWVEGKTMHSSMKKWGGGVWREEHSD